jgi:hypothetical protein
MPFATTTSASGAIATMASPAANAAVSGSGACPCSQCRFQSKGGFSGPPKNNGRQLVRAAARG